MVTVGLQMLCSMSMQFIRGTEVAGTSSGGPRPLRTLLALLPARVCPATAVGQHQQRSSGQFAVVPKRTNQMPMIQVGDARKSDPAHLSVHDHIDATPGSRGGEA